MSHIYHTYIQDASLLLQTLQTLLSTSLSNLEVKSFVDVEVALRMMYLAGEAVTDKVRVVCDNHYSRALAPTSIKHSILANACEPPLILRNYLKALEMTGAQSA